MERTSGPLADGLEILDGSALLGTVFENGSGWSATLRIEGDPRQLMDAYRGQVETVLGVPVRPDTATGCGPQLTRPPFEVLCRPGAATPAHWVGLRMLISGDDDRAYLDIDRADPSAAPPAQRELPPLPGGGTAPVTDEILGPAIRRR